MGVIFFVVIFVLISVIVAVIVFYFVQNIKEQKAMIEQYFETHYGETDYVIEDI